MPCIIIDWWCNFISKSAEIAVGEDVENRTVAGMIY